MPILAGYLKSHPQETEIKGIIGITTINKGILPLGFESISPSSFLYRRLKKFGQLPIFLLTKSSFENFNKNKLNYLLMSKEMLYQKYGSNPSSK
jgi:hypothetical protein